MIQIVRLTPTTSGVRQRCILVPHCSVLLSTGFLNTSVHPWISISNSSVIDLVYADDTALLLPSVGNAASYLSSFSTADAPLCLKIFWEKTKLQNLGSGPQPTDISVAGNRVDSVDSFYRTSYALCGICHGRVSVCVCLSQAGIASKRLYIRSRKQRHTIAQGL